MIMNPKNHARAVRYRQLALAEADKAKAAVLYKIADEAERDVLCTVDRPVRGGGLGQSGVLLEQAVRDRRKSKG
jgi:hypothetical protein